MGLAPPVAAAGVAIEGGVQDVEAVDEDPPPRRRGRRGLGRADRRIGRREGRLDHRVHHPSRFASGRCGSPAAVFGHDSFAPVPVHSPPAPERPSGIRASVASATPAIPA